MAAPKSVLIVCTGNCCRSQMAEALLRQMAGPRLEVRSAGSDPAGYIHPLAIDTMRRMGIPLVGQYSKSWNELADLRHDIVITVCDHAACSPAPAWRGKPVIIHWSLPDPSFAPGSIEDRLAAADAVAQRLQEWFRQLLALPLEDLPPERLQLEIDRIPQSCPSIRP